MSEELDAIKAQLETRAADAEKKLAILRARRDTVNSEIREAVEEQREAELAILRARRDTVNSEIREAVEEQREAARILRATRPRTRKTKTPTAGKTTTPTPQQKADTAS